MSTPYHHLHVSARKEVLHHKTFYEQKLQECEKILEAFEALPTFFEHNTCEAPPSASTDNVMSSDSDESSLEKKRVQRANDSPPSSRARRPKENLYDEEMRRLLSQVKIASKMATYQHYHAALRGGAVESYLKRAVLRGVIVRVRRGEYALSAQVD
jgi:hypothetical protein